MRAAALFFTPATVGRICASGVEINAVHKEANAPATVGRFQDGIRSKAVPSEIELTCHGRSSRWDSKLKSAFFALPATVDRREGTEAMNLIVRVMSAV